MPSVRRAVGNMVNTRGDRRHDHLADDRANDRLVYSPYNGDVHSPGKLPLYCLCRQRRGMLVAAAVVTMRSSSVVNRCPMYTFEWCG